MKNPVHKHVGYAGEMEHFFRQYSNEQRAKAEADPDYREAMRNADFVRAQEVANRVIEGDSKNFLDAQRKREYR